MGYWKTIDQREEVVGVELFFEVPDMYIDWYLDNTIAMQCAGAMQVEKALLFLKYISGSYSAIIGLPLFELRNALEMIGFFEHTNLSV